MLVMYSYFPMKFYEERVRLRLDRQRKDAETF